MLLNLKSKTPIVTFLIFLRLKIHNYLYTMSGYPNDSIIKEVKEKYSNHFESGYMSIIKRDEINDIVNDIFNLKIHDKKLIREFVWCINTLRDELSSSCVLVFDFRGHYNISKRQQDSITAFLRKKGFKYNYSIGTYFI